MHKKECLEVVIIQMIAAFVLAVCSANTAFQIQENKNSAYHIKNPYNTFSVHIDFPANGNWKSSLQAQLHSMLKDKKATIILDNDSSFGIGLYDSLGIYPEAKALSASANSIIAEENSSAAEAAEKQNGLFFSHGKTYRMRGKCPRNFPLWDSTHFYLYPFVSSWDFSGTYYVISADSGFTDKFAALFSKYGECSSIVHNASPEKQAADPGSALAFIVNQHYFPIFAFGILILYFQFVLFFTFFVRSRRRLIFIHLRFGATKGRLLAWFSQWMLPCCFGGAFLGVSAYYLLVKLVFRQKILILPAPWLIGTAIFHGILTYLIFTVVLLRTKTAGMPAKPHKCRKGAAV